MLHKNSFFFLVLIVVLIACNKNNTDPNNITASTTDNSIAKQLEGSYIEHAYKYGYGKPTCGFIDSATSQVQVVKFNDSTVIVLNSYIQDSLLIKVLTDTSVVSNGFVGKLSSDFKNMTDFQFLSSNWPCAIATNLNLEKQ